VTLVLHAVGYYLSAGITLGLYCLLMAVLDEDFRRRWLSDGATSAAVTLAGSFCVVLFAWPLLLWRAWS
jgi:hypothetical protein